jgi:hypothetical protein
MRHVETTGHTECNLLNLGKVVLGILVQGELADRPEGEVLVGPDVGQVKDVDPLLGPEVLGLLLRHGLHLHGPRWESGWSVVHKGEHQPTHSPRSMASYKSFCE